MHMVVAVFCWVCYFVGLCDVWWSVNMHTLVATTECGLGDRV